jgi:hypothetical protein
MLEDMWNLLEEADYVVGFNSAAFDVKWINAEFVTEGFPPPASYQQIDLIRVARKNFRFLSNKLQHIADKLDIGSKVKHHGFELWRDCMAGDKKAWALMKRYNKGDVKLTEDLFYALLPWLDGPLNWGLFVNADVPTCPNCGSQSLTLLDKPARTRVSEFDQYRCDDCMSISRERKRSVTPQEGVLK